MWCLSLCLLLASLPHSVSVKARVCRAQTEHYSSPVEAVVVLPLLPPLRPREDRDSVALNKTRLPSAPLVRSAAPNALLEPPRKSCRVHRRRLTLAECIVRSHELLDTALAQVAAAPPRVAVGVSMARPYAADAVHTGCTSRPSRSVASTRTADSATAAAAACAAATSGGAARMRHGLLRSSLLAPLPLILRTLILTADRLRRSSAFPHHRAHRLRLSGMPPRVLRTLTIRAQ